MSETVRFFNNEVRTLFYNMSNHGLGITGALASSMGRFDYKNIEPSESELKIWRGCGLGSTRLASNTVHFGLIPLYIFPFPFGLFEGSVSLSMETTNNIKNKIFEIDAAIAFPDDQKNHWNTKRDVVNLSNLSRDLKSLLKIFQTPLRLKNPQSYYYGSNFYLREVKHLCHKMVRIIPLVGFSIADYFFGPHFIGDVSQYDKLIESNTSFYQRHEGAISLVFVGSALAAIALRTLEFI